MAEDKREDILVALLGVAKSVMGEDRAFRNKINISEKARPCVIILDADEHMAPLNASEKRPSNAPLVIDMTPEVYIYLSEGHEDVGTELNAWRAKIIKAVLTAEPIRALCHDGYIKYEGCATALASGRSIEGEAGLSFTFRYILKPEKL